tara:strand:+ start:623 stop:808 length:186 start_codon:yes stop_codon:yes gene_type:complete
MAIQGLKTPPAKFELLILEIFEFVTAARQLKKAEGDKRFLDNMFFQSVSPSVCVFVKYKLF